MRITPRVCTSVLSLFSVFTVVSCRRACTARVTVVVLCVCLCVCVSVCLYAHAILAVCMFKSIMKDTIVLSVRFAAILKRHFPLNCLIRKLEHFLLTLVGTAIFSWCLLRMQCFVYSPLHVCLRVKHCI